MNKEKNKENNNNLNNDIDQEIWSSSVPLSGAPTSEETLSVSKRPLDYSSLSVGSKQTFQDQGIRENFGETHFRFNVDSMTEEAFKGLYDELITKIARENIIEVLDPAHERFLLDKAVYICEQYQNISKDEARELVVKDANTCLNQLREQIRSMEDCDEPF